MRRPGKILDYDRDEGAEHCEDREIGEDYDQSEEVRPGMSTEVLLSRTKSAALPEFLERCEPSFLSAIIRGV